MKDRRHTSPIIGYLEQQANMQRFRKENIMYFRQLTERETEVLTMIAEGNKNPAIAKSLEISRNTVQNHRASIREKLHINTQFGFVKFALAYDLIQF